MAINIPSMYRNPTAVTNRTAEVLSAKVDFEGGMNLAASNAPGIGIGTANICKEINEDETWTVNDQTDTARTPQKSQHIGGSGYTDVLDGEGDEEAYPITYVTAQLDETTPDYNDTAHFQEATAPVAPDGAMPAGGINKTGKTVQIGERIWAVVAQA